MTSAFEWEDIVGRSWADMHERTDRSYAPLTARMLRLLEAIPGQAILDIGSGAGELSLALAEARPAARVVGVDVSPDLVKVAQKRGVGRGNATFVLADAAQWRPGGFTPDLLVSRHGVMFFPGPGQAFEHLRALAAPGANLLFSCFRALAENPWSADVARLLPPDPGAGPPASPTAPGPFSFADPDHVRVILEQSGWDSIEIVPFDFPWVVGKGDDPVADGAAYLSRIGPAAAAMRRLEGEERTRFQASLLEWLEAQRKGDEIAFGAAAWIVTARSA